MVEKMVFALEMVGEWPPVATEAVWCERWGNAFKLMNAPFFIRGLAYGDVFQAAPDSANRPISEFKVIEESGHSLVWMVNNTDVDLSAFKRQLLALGCRMEGFRRFSLHAIDVPPGIDNAQLNALIDAAEIRGLDFAFPVWRHGVETGYEK